jgi:hypothetical protein
MQRAVRADGQAHPQFTDCCLIRVSKRSSLQPRLVGARHPVISRQFDDLGAELNIIGPQSSSTWARERQPDQAVCVAGHRLASTLERLYSRLGGRSGCVLPGHCGLGHEPHAGRPVDHRRARHGNFPTRRSRARTLRSRLNRGGDRAANNALWTISMVRMRSDPRTRAYVARRTAEGLSTKEIQRCLKRYIVRELYPLILADLAESARPI